jgi:hypothetical protein
MDYSKNARNFLKCMNMLFKPFNLMKELQVRKSAIKRNCQYAISSLLEWNPEKVLYNDCEDQFREYLFNLVENEKDRYKKIPLLFESIMEIISSIED